MPLPSINTNTNLGEAFVLYNTGAEKPLVQLIQFLMRNEDSPLSIGQRELLAAFISGLNECTYCEGSHNVCAIHFGVNPGLLKELLDDIKTADYDEDFKPILQYVKKLTLAPAKMTQEDIDPVLNAGWSERALYDAIMICGLFNMINRYVDGVGLTTHPELFDKAADRLKGGFDYMLKELRD